MPPRDGKFNNVTFSTDSVEQWTPGLETGQGFRCSRPEFNTFWRKGRVQREVEASVCSCWILRHNSALAGYITLLADKLSASEGPLLSGENILYETFPAIKIGLLAADERAKGAGSCLIDWVLEFISTKIAPNVGVRFVTVDALYDPDEEYDVSTYYRRWGFEYAYPDEPLPPPDGFRTMYLDLLPFIEALRYECEK